MAEEQFTYQPGVCNIDDAGVRWRRRLGYICLGGGIVSLSILYYLHFGMIYRFCIGSGFGFMTSLNLIQAKEHFCAMNASKRTFEVGLHQTKIAEDLYKELDMKKRRSMMLRSLIFAAIGGCLGLFPL